MSLMPHGVKVGRRCDGSRGELREISRLFRLLYIRRWQWSSPEHIEINNLGKDKWMWNKNIILINSDLENRSADVIRLPLVPLKYQLMSIQWIN